MFPMPEIKYGKDPNNNWDLYAEYVPITSSFLSVSMGIKGTRERPEIIQIEMKHSTMSAGRQVIKYDVGNNTKETYWTHKKVIRDNGPDILSKIAEACPNFQKDINGHFNMNIV